MKKYIALLGLALGLATSASAEKSAIILRCAAGDDDTAGKRLCMELRDAITRSPRYREVYSSPLIHNELHVTSLPIKGSNGSAQAVVITNKSGSTGPAYYMTSFILLTPLDKAASQAEDILADLDNEANE